MDPALQEMIAAGDPDEQVEAILRLDPEAGDVPPMVRVGARFSDLMTVRLRRGDLAAAWGHPATASLKAPAVLRVDAPPPAAADGAPGFPSAGHADRPAPAAGPGLADPHHPADLWATLLDRPQGGGPRPGPRPSLAREGRGVVLGVIDWGFDFAHPAFRDAAGRSRIAALWDQRGGPSSRGHLGYGRVHWRAGIDRALASGRPYAALGYHPGDADRGDGAHGTHVADIAGGSRRADGGGVAPQADLVFVHLATAPLTGLANLGDSVRLLEAVDFVARVAGGRPLVINLSVGRHAGPHTGLTPVEQALDRFLEAAPGRMIVQSAGNYAQAGAHAQGRLIPGAIERIAWHTRPNDRTPNELEIWYPDRDRLRIGLRPPGAARAAPIELGESRAFHDATGREIARAYHRAYDPNGADRHVEVFLRPGAPAGRWEVTLEGDIVEDGRWHAWIERDSGDPRDASRFAPGRASVAGTLGSICNGFLTVAVGAADCGPDGRLRGAAPFASAGPTRDGRQKPDLCAPGLRVPAARSTPRGSDRPRPGITAMSGASQAAPHVAGLAAAMLSEPGPPAPIHALRRRLFALCEPLPPALAHLGPRLGAGLARPGATGRPSA